MVDMNTNKYWKCKECGLLNYKQSNKCIACFNNNTNNNIPSTKIGNEWTKSCSNTLPNLLKIRYKMISWNNKLYSLAISCQQSDDNVNISMLDHTEMKLDESYHQNASFIRDITYDIDTELGELYILLEATNLSISSSANSIEIRLLLVIYDLNEQKTKRIIKVDCNELNIILLSENQFGCDGLCIFKIKNQLSLHQQIPFNIIKYWQRSQVFKLNYQAIPYDIYEIINNFYTLYQQNKIHIAFRSEAIYILKHRWQELRCTICHGIIDISDKRKDHVEMQVIHHKTRHNVGWDTKNSLFRIVNGTDFYWYFRDIVYCINLINGNIKEMQHTMNIKQCIGGPLLYDALEINESNKRYLYLLKLGHGKDDWHLLCFDKLKMEIIPLKTMKSLNINSFPYEMIYHDGYLYIGRDIHYQLQFEQYC